MIRAFRRSVILALALVMLTLILPSPALAAAPTLLSATVIDTGVNMGHVMLTFDQAMAAPGAGAAGFLVTGAFGQNKNVSSATLQTDTTQILLTLGITVKGGEQVYGVSVQYTPGMVESAEGDALESFYSSVDNPLPHPTLGAASPPNGVVGTPYNFTFTASGGTAPYTFYLLSGTLPLGLTLTGTGVLSGTPTTSGTFNFRINVLDANSALDLRNITITIANAGAVAPTVVTNAATGVTATGATLNGDVTADGGSSVLARGFVYGLTADPAIGGPGVTEVTAVAGTGAFSAAASGLAPGTTYHVRAYATNTPGTSYGGDVTFTTPGVTPLTVVTYAATNVTVSSAKLNGAVTADGGLLVTERGFVCSLAPNPVIGGAGVTQIASGSGLGTFSAVLTGLSENTTVHVRAYAVNRAGVSYGEEIVFTTDITVIEIDRPPQTGGADWCGYAGFALLVAGGLMLARRRKAAK